MSDEALRAAERRWRASGSVEDEAAYLNERVRGGEVLVGRLQQAAILRHPAAMLATGPAPCAGASMVELVDFAMMDDLEGMVRTCLALAEQAYTHRLHSHRFSEVEAEEQLDQACRELVYRSERLHLSPAVRALAVCCSVGDADYDQTFQFRDGTDEETFWDAMVWVSTNAFPEINAMHPPILKGLIPWLLYGQDPVRSLLHQIAEHRRFRNDLERGDQTP